MSSQQHPINFFELEQNGVAYYVNLDQIITVHEHKAEGGIRVNMNGHSGLGPTFLLTGGDAERLLTILKSRSHRTV